MATFRVKLHDTTLPLTVDTDLTGASVKAFIRSARAEGEVPAVVPVNVTDPVVGAFDLILAEVGSGEFDLEVLVEKGGEQVRTPSVGFDRLVIGPNLDNPLAAPYVPSATLEQVIEEKFAGQADRLIPFAETAQEAAADAGVFAAATEFDANRAGESAFQAGQSAGYALGHRNAAKASTDAAVAAAASIAKDVPGGVPGLDGDARVPDARMPERLSPQALNSAIVAVTKPIVDAAIPAQTALDRRRVGALLSLPPVGTRPLWPWQLSNGTDTGQNTFIQHMIPADIAEIRFAFVSLQAVAEAAAPNAFGMRVGMMIPDGTVLPVYFSGRRDVTVERYAISDPIAIPRGIGWIQSRTYVSVASGQKWPTGFPDNMGTTYGPYDGAEKGTSITDKSLAGTIASPGNSGVAMYGPTVIMGRPAGGDWGALPAIGGVGDSILYGQGDRLFGASGRGFFERAINNQVGFLNLGAPTETAQNFITAGGGALRSLMLAGMKSVLCEYGRNDVAGGATYNQTRAYLLAAWRRIKAASGGKVFQTTIVPTSASTDGWLTAASQTTDATNAVRVQVNDWLRDGSPMNTADNTAAAVGASGAGIVRAGAAGHPLEAYFDIADAVETARNSGIWKQDPNLRVVTDASMNSGSDVLTSATAAFVPGDVDEKYARVIGAGASGAVLLGRIRFRTGATTVNLTGSAGTTVSGAQATIAGRFTADGVHPDVLATRAMAAAIDVARMIAG